MSRLRSALLGCVLAFVATVAIAHAAKERKKVRELDRTLVALTEHLEVKATDNRRSSVTINGVRMSVELTSAGALSEAAASEVERCRRDQGGDLPSSDQSSSKQTLIHREDRDDASAVLCRLGSTTRLTWLRRIDDRSTSAMTITSPTLASNVEAMFPDEGDAPGSDLEGVPRPAGSRRVATMQQGDYGVRIYAVREQAMDRAVALLSERMKTAGFEEGRVVSPDARLYAMPGSREQIVASWTRIDDELRVAMVRLEL